MSIPQIGPTTVVSKAAPGVKGAKASRGKMR